MTKTPPCPTLARMLALLLALLAPATAAPAPWYVWRSTLDGARICAQTMQGEWEQVSGPYRDAGCTQAGRPGR